MARMDQPSKHDAQRAIIDQLARGTLRVSLATSRNRAFLVIAVGLAGSWLIIHLAGGADSMVPH